MQGSALHIRARHEKIIGKDPRPSLKKAISSLQKAIAQNPKDTVYYNRLGSVYFRIAEYETHNGLDPRNSLKSAINQYHYLWKSTLILSRPIPTWPTPIILFGRMENVKRTRSCFEL